ncbi:MAG: ATP-binding protein, partial [Acidilobus sp.]
MLGLRRTGKSSVIMLSLNELGLPYIYVDLRKFEEKGFASYRDLVVELEREVNRLTNRFPGLLELLRRVEGVEVMGSGVRLRWGGRKRVTISSLLEA